MTDAKELDGSTVSDLSDAGAPSFEPWLKRVTVGFIILLFIGGLTGVLGVRTTTDSVEAGGVRLSSTYAWATRPGLATPFSLLIETTDSSPLPAEVTVGITLDYLAILDRNGLEPTPADSFADGETLWLTFAVPEGEPRLRVVIDARLEPSVQWARSGTVSVMAGEASAALQFRTWVLP